MEVLLTPSPCSSDHPSHSVRCPLCKNTQNQEPRGNESSRLYLTSFKLKNYGEEARENRERSGELLVWVRGDVSVELEVWH